MTVLQTPGFARAVRKLHLNQKSDLDAAIRVLLVQPTIGNLKQGELAGIRVYKFSMNRQLTLVTYSCDESLSCLTLLALGSHENFYRDLKSNGG